MGKVKDEVYREDRKQLINAELEEARHFDKYILTLAAGTFGLSFAFFDKIAPQPESATLWILVTAWVFFAKSILSTLISFLLSQEAYSKEVEMLDEWYKKNTEDKGEKIKKNVFSTWTKWLNRTSISLFTVGVVFLILFSTLNLFS